MPLPGPQPFVTPEQQQRAAELVAAMSDAELAGAVIMASSADAVDTDLVQRLHLGGVILMGSQGTVDGTTGGTPEQVAAVSAALQEQAGEVPILIATDQEYGTVSRLINGFTEFPGAGDLAATGDTELTERIATAAAAEMRAVGIDVNFAPDADLLPPDGFSSIGDRSYGSNPERVAEFVAAAVRGYQAGGVAATLKHFPGIGSLEADTHQTLPELSIDCESWNTGDAVPMAAGIDAGVAMVMTGHVTMPAVGVDGVSSVESTIVTDLLGKAGADGCQGLGFTGIRVTDSLQMAPIANTYSSGEAAVAALTAGEDLLLMPVDPSAAAKGIVDALEAGTLDRGRVVEAAVKVLSLRLALAATPRPDLSVIGSPDHEDLAAQGFGG